MLHWYAVLSHVPPICFAFNLGYYWLKGKASFKVCHAETGPALKFPLFLSI